ncbi:hypothetical protein TBLA_0B09813 [Henningerozyma blattae CBS 6284]|uniref:Uncharacterized protein n=1 Tax=Henningerozyma blattae (strain ATCC 34711 / CBS 6284 / DSM 70876 / NBRC 10599 / NRRL Y-10934 / UCD 77-7) TaxID=1071380 RepID=I2H096_HENB6|nr:hypothetical protein TBLA_0B09813 [Tetrapisispora blattae CBS 6284]CCH59798.1 hypothetical protein TBLA_0B09813 [Tetrapisispora blattae CBS 6284]
MFFGNSEPKPEELEVGAETQMEQHESAMTHEAKEMVDDVETEAKRMTMMKNKNAGRDQTSKQKGYYIQPQMEGKPVYDAEGNLMGQTIFVPAGETVFVSKQGESHMDKSDMKEQKSPKQTSQNSKNKNFVYVPPVDEPKDRHNKRSGTVNSESGMKEGYEMNMGAKSSHSKSGRNSRKTSTSSSSDKYMKGHNKIDHSKEPEEHIGKKSHKSNKMGRLFLGRSSTVDSDAMGPSEEMEEMDSRMANMSMEDEYDESGVQGYSGPVDARGKRYSVTEMPEVSRRKSASWYAGSKKSGLDDDRYIITGNEMRPSSGGHKFSIGSEGDHIYADAVGNYPSMVDPTVMTYGNDPRKNFEPKLQPDYIAEQGYVGTNIMVDANESQPRKGVYQRKVSGSASEAFKPEKKLSLNNENDSRLTKFRKSFMRPTL